MHWFYLAIAIVSNVGTNLFLKKTMNTVNAPLGLELGRQMLFSPWLWAALVTGGVLLTSYLLAIRTLDLSVSYAFVTSAALLGITVTSSVVFGEPFTGLKVTGVFLIISGLMLILR